MTTLKLDADVLSFLRRAAQLLEPSATAAEDDGDADEFRLQEVCSTLVEQIRGHEVMCARHVFGSSTLQRALAVGSDEQRAALAAPLFSAKHALTALTDKYASHVLEAALARVLPSLQRIAQAGDDALTPSLATSVVTMSDALLADEARALRQAMNDRYATHVVRAMFQVLSGQHFEQSSAEWGGGGGGKWDAGGGGGSTPPWRKPSRVTDTPARVEVPSSFTAALERVAAALVELDGKGEEGTGGEWSEGGWYGEGGEDWGEPAAAEGGDGSRGKRGGGGGVLGGLARSAAASPALQALLSALPPSSSALHALCARLLLWPAQDAALLTPSPEASTTTSDAQAGREGRRPPETVLVHVRSLATDRAGSHLLEAIVKAAPSWWHPLYAHVFRSSLAELCTHHVANFVVQALLSAAPNAPALGKLLRELLPAVPELLHTRPGASTLLKMAQESSRQGAAGKELIRALRTASTSQGGGEGSPAFACALLAIGAHPGAATDHGEWQGGGSVVVGGVGSRLVQALASLPAGAADALLASAAALPPPKLVSLALHAQGSRALEALLTSACGAAARLSIANALCESAARLARDRSGSHVLEAAFRASAVERRGRVLEALSTIEHDLRASGHGGALLKKLRFDHWRHHFESWQKGEQRAHTATRAFAEILAEEPASGGSVGSAAAAARPAKERAERPPLRDQDRDRRDQGRDRRGAQASAPAGPTSRGATAEAADDDVGVILAGDLGELDAIFGGTAALPGSRKKKGANPPPTSSRRNAREEPGKWPEQERSASKDPPSGQSRSTSKWERSKAAEGQAALQAPPRASPTATQAPPASQGVSGFAKKRRLAAASLSTTEPSAPARAGNGDGVSPVSAKRARKARDQADGAEGGRAARLSALLQGPAAAAASGKSGNGRKRFSMA